MAEAIEANDRHWLVRWRETPLDQQRPSSRSADRPSFAGIFKLILIPFGLHKVENSSPPLGRIGGTNEINSRIPEMCKARVNVWRREFGKLLIDVGFSFLFVECTASLP